MATGVPTQHQERFYRLAMLIPLVGGYIFVNFHRVSMAVMAPDLMSEFLVGATAIGFMSSLFFYAYSLAQIPIGIMTDMVGARRVVTLCLLITALGAIVFGLATNSMMVILGRMIMGMGVAGIYPPAMKLFSQWYKGEGFSSITGFYISSGNIGAILAAAPFAYVVAQWGWRQSHIFIGVISVVLALGAWITIRENPQELTKGPQKLEFTGWSHAWSSFREAASNRVVLLIGFLLFLKYGPFMGVQGLWGIPFFTDVYNLDRVTAGGLLAFIPVGYMVGAPITGYLLSHGIGTKKGLYVIAAASMVVMWIPLVIPQPDLAIGWFRLIFFLLGVASSCQGVLSFSLTRDMVEQKVAGTSMAIVSVFPFAAATVFQPLMGAVLDIFGAGEVGFSQDSYYLAFRFCLLSLILLFIGVFYLKEKPQEIAQN